MASCTNQPSLNHSDRCSHWSSTSPPRPRSPEADAAGRPRRLGHADEERPRISLALLARRDADGRPAIRIQERLAKAGARRPTGRPRAPCHAAARARGGPRPARAQRSDHALEAETDALAAAWEVVTRRPPPGRWERSDAIWASARRVSGLRRGRSSRLSRCRRTSSWPRGRGRRARSSRDRRRCWPPPWRPECSPLDTSS